MTPRRLPEIHELRVLLPQDPRTQKPSGSHRRPGKPEPWPRLSNKLLDELEALCSRPDRGPRVIVSASFLASLIQANRDLNALLDQ